MSAPMSHQQFVNTPQDRVNGFKGRLMLPDKSEYALQVLRISTSGATLQTSARAAAGNRIISYIENIGRIDGTLTDVFDDGIELVFNLSEIRKKKLRQILKWNEDGSKENRRHARIVPQDRYSRIILADGKEYDCSIIDLSISGAAVKLATGPEPHLGAYVTLKDKRGRVMRYVDSGFAIEFSTPLAQAAL